jgi:hypothetical protein
VINCISLNLVPNHLKRKICIITPGTIASNPRVVKEAEALSEAGYKVHLIYTRHVDYLIQEDENILKAHPEWTSDHLDWAEMGITARSIKLLSGLRKKAATLILKSGLYSELWTAFLFNRFYSWQLKKAQAYSADLYIAHYPECIAIAAKAARINNARFAFDAEDFHREEDIPFEQIRATIAIESRFLKHASYISAASPLIARAYQGLFPDVNVYTLENMFPLKYQFAFSKLRADTFKFFWFSQTVGPKRGLEEFIHILSITNRKNIQLTFLGHCNSSYKFHLESLWLKGKLKPELLLFINTLPEREIFQLAAEHHFGLCLEVPHSVNRNICLTNKIYTYILSGNQLILSDTQAQREFHNRNPKTGICINLRNRNEAASEILNLMNDQALNEKRRHNYEFGHKVLNFDQEKTILLKRVANLWK